MNEPAPDIPSVKTWKPFILGVGVTLIVLTLLGWGLNKKMLLSLELNQDLQLQLDTEVPFKTHLKRTLKYLYRTQ